MVAIKDFGMPSCCENCNINKFDYLGSQGTAHWNCAITENECEDYENKRNSDCPLIEIEERKVGKWIYKKLGVRTFGIVCSSCNRVYHEGQNIGSLEEFKSDIERIMRERNVTLDEYCCHCGADMRGAENG